MITNCECILAGYCTRHRVYKHQHWVTLCQTRPEYFKQWEEGRGPGHPKQNNPVLVVPHIMRDGVGTELKVLLAKFGIIAQGGCSCDRRANEMNARGIDWCKSHVSTIVGWLEQEARQRKLPFVKTVGAILVKRAIRNAERVDVNKIKWAVGLTTVRERLGTTLQPTLQSLEDAGFDKPHLFVDDVSMLEWCQRSDGLMEYNATVRGNRVRTFINYVLGLAELYARNPQADRYVMFQDDVVLSRNVRHYLDRLRMPDKSYWNLHAFPVNERLFGEEPGWYKSDQSGKSATGLIYSNQGVMDLLTHTNTITRPKEVKGHQNIDGWVMNTLRKRMQYVEYCHNPSLLQHVGHQSSMGHSRYQQSRSFRGEDFDCMELLK